MDADFWHERWREHNIGFHQPETNKLLMKHWPSVCPDETASVFVPLCGKSLDMIWLAQRGHTVIGVELSDIAVAEFFSENGLEARSRREGAFDVSTASVATGGSVELWCGDVFAFPKARLSGVKAAFDRASLIALPADMRKRYAAHLSALLPHDAVTLLLTIDYDQSQMDGPPFAVPDTEVVTLFAGLRKVEHLETRDALAGSKNLQDRGLDALTTSAFVIGTERRQ